MAQQGKWVGFWGWFLVVLGIAAGAVNLYGVTVLQRISDPPTREQRAEWVLKKYGIFAEHGSNETAASAVQSYFGRRVMNATFFLLGGLALLSRREKGRKLCIGALLLFSLWTVVGMLSLYRQGAPLLKTIGGGVSSLAGAGLLWWWLARSQVKMQFQSKT